VSVIVPVYRDADRLRGCVRALAGQTYPRERFEIIVVNNDPDWTRRSTRA
jgi:glycosyltransferase involved in cell wall biosynthesis